MSEIRHDANRLSNRSGPAAPGECRGCDPRYLAELTELADDVHRFVGRRVANPADAADIAQDTILLALEKLETFRGGRFPVWLFAIARHRVIDYHRRRRRFRHVDAGELAEVEPALQTLPADVLGRVERRHRPEAILARVIGRLALEQQLAVLLADVYGSPDRHSATLLRMTVPSYKWLLHQARTHLRLLARDEPSTRGAPGNGGFGRARRAPAARTSRRRRPAGCDLGRPLPDSLIELRRTLVDGLRDFFRPN